MMKSVINPSSIIFFVFCNTVGFGKAPEQIVGGSSTSHGEYPFVVSLHKSAEYICSGSIIDERHILTAAHCVVTRQYIIITDIMVRIGSPDLYDDTDAKFYSIIYTLYHHQYRPENVWSNDISILTLDRAIIFSHLVKPIRLPESVNMFSWEDFARAVGWGQMYAHDVNPPRFQRTIIVQIISLDLCMYTWGMDSIKELEIICTVGKGNQSLSRGNSGSPLIYANRIIGLCTAGGLEAPVRTFPDIFVRVDTYLEWIEKNLEKY